MFIVCINTSIVSTICICIVQYSFIVNYYYFYKFNYLLLIIILVYQLQIVSTLIVYVNSYIYSFLIIYVKCQLCQQCALLIILTVNSVLHYLNCDNRQHLTVSTRLSIGLRFILIDLINNHVMMIFILFVGINLVDI